MISLGVGENAFDKLKTEISLFSAVIDKVEVYRNDFDDPTIDITFEGLQGYGSRKLLIRFEELKEFLFFYTSDYYFYNIETFKALKIDEYYYLSFDPDDQIRNYSVNDKDYIFAKKIALFWI